MSDRSCSVEGCERKYIARGLCDMHYQRLRLKGDVGPVRSVARLPEMPCKICGKSFSPYRDTQQTCSTACRRRATAQKLIPSGRELLAFECVLCGAHFERAGTNVKYCDACQPEAFRQKRARRDLARRGSEKVRSYNRMKQLERYGITVEQHDEMLAAQNGLCAICGSPPDPNGVRATSRLHTDHDHVTGQVRALLCNNCNRGIGCFADDPVRLRAAADYIDRHRAI